MPRISPQILSSPSTLIHFPHTPAGGLTLILRSLQIPIIENLESIPSYIRLSTIDLTHNGIVTLGNFPQSLNNVECVLIGRNRISSIQQNLHEQLPNLNSLSLISNNLSMFEQIIPLKELKKLKVLYLSNNAITKLGNYRLFTLWLLPQLTVLDGEKITKKERDESLRLFGDDMENITALGSSLLNGSSSAVAQDVNDDDDHIMMDLIKKKLTEEDKIKLKKELTQATSLLEIERIEQALKSGYV